MTLSDADGLFVYGTLRPGGRNHGWIRRTQPEGSSLAYCPGRLFQLPGQGYPAVILAAEPAGPPPGPGWVVGEFIGYEDEQALDDAVQDLDPLEDVEGGLFQRLLTPVVLDSGLRFQAWVYVFPEDRLLRLERDAVELTGGDWSAYF